jgi:hypothetical protein
MTVIKDGTGTGNLAKVDDLNRLSTTGIGITEASESSVIDHLAFSLIGTTLITNVEKTILVLINNATSTKKLSIQRHRIGLQGETGKPATFKTYIGNKTYTASGTVATPVNLYTGSADILDITAYQDNPTLGGTDVQIQQAYLETTSIVDTEFDGALIAPPSSSIRVTVTGDSTASGTKNAFARILYHSLQEQLYL